MKFNALFAAAACFLLAGASPTSPLAPPLPSLLHSRNVFYRAVTGNELAEVNTIYRIEHSPTKHTTTPGDFSYAGGLYVFHDINEAKQWGTCWAKVQQDPKKKHWYLIKFQYTPNTSLKTLTFNTPTAQWKKFVNENYDKQGPHYDAIEGPISVGHGERLQAYINSNQVMVWQAAFVGQHGLKTLIVTEVTQYDDKGQVKECCRNCNIQFRDQSPTNEWAMFEDIREQEVL